LPVGECDGLFQAGREGRGFDPVSDHGADAGQRGDIGDVQPG